MTKRPLSNMAASVHARILNASKRADRPFNDLVMYYAMERFLYRLAQSPHRHRFVLKGALMLHVWNAPITRLTRDIDLLGRIDQNLDAVGAMIVDVCTLPVDDDGLIFDPATIATQPLAELAGHHGVRVQFRGHLGTTRLPMQIDVGTSDVITPEAVAITYPTILNHPPAELLAYNRPTVIAEKFEAMVKLGELNSRMKDFFDVWLLAKSFEFDGHGLMEAIRATFHHRQTELHRDPVCFSPRFAGDQAKMAQWRGFVNRSRFHQPLPDLAEVTEFIRGFLQPVAHAIINDDSFDNYWLRGGPWHKL